ncbi:MAG: hypothetical protein KC766_01535 [Myxococcales bacterium]|nr:hypothetical protein [Myxococcales bacterium]
MNDHRRGTHPYVSPGSAQTAEGPEYRQSQVPAESGLQPTGSEGPPTARYPEEAAPATYPGPPPQTGAQRKGSSSDYEAQAAPATNPHGSGQYAAVPEPAYANPHHPSAGAHPAQQAPAYSTPPQYPSAPPPQSGYAVAPPPSYAGSAQPAPPYAPGSYGYPPAPAYSPEPPPVQAAPAPTPYPAPERSYTPPPGSMPVSRAMPQPSPPSVPSISTGAPSSSRAETNHELHGVPTQRRSSPPPSSLDRTIAPGDLGRRTISLTSPMGKTQVIHPEAELIPDSGARLIASGAATQPVQGAELHPQAPEWMRMGRLLALQIEDAIAQNQSDPSTRAAILRAWAAWQLGGYTRRQLSDVSSNLMRAYRMAMQSSSEHRDAVLNDCAGVVYSTLPVFLRKSCDRNRVIVALQLMSEFEDEETARFEGLAVVLRWSDQARVLGKQAIACLLGELE